MNSKQKPLIMGILNVTPDSFSDGGSYLESDSAIEHGLKLIEMGADIIDIGGESTRPGADAISPPEEQDRILPVIEGLKGVDALISVDTRHASTMKASVSAGASMINDVSALRGEGSIEMAASLKVPVCLMHMQGAPGTMQKKPVYDDVVEEIYAFLEERISSCLLAGMNRDALIIDPGIGFGKTLEHNLKILNHLEKFKNLDAPILIGTSRKSFIDKLVPETPIENRLPGSLASLLWAYQKGARIFRVHDVKETKQALMVFQSCAIEN